MKNLEDTSKKLLFFFNCYNNVYRLIKIKQINKISNHNVHLNLYLILTSS